MQKSVFCSEASQSEHFSTLLSNKSLAAVRQKVSLR
jgi:hypothetical protein